MKTILSNGVYDRVTDEVADHEVKMGRAKFVPKSEWKKNVRDVEKAARAEAEKAKAEAKAAKAETKVDKAKRKG
jgi:hypothetical protein